MMEAHGAAFTNASGSRFKVGKLNDAVRALHGKARAAILGEERVQQIKEEARRMAREAAREAKRIKDGKAAAPITTPCSQERNRRDGCLR